MPCRWCKPTVLLVNATILGSHWLQEQFMSDGAHPFPNNWLICFLFLCFSLLLKLIQSFGPLKQPVSLVLGASTRLSRRVISWSSVNTDHKEAWLATADSFLQNLVCSLGLSVYFLVLLLLFCGRIVMSRSWSNCNCNNSNGNHNNTRLSFVLNGTPKRKGKCPRVLYPVVQ